MQTIVRDSGLIVPVSCKRIRRHARIGTMGKYEHHRAGRCIWMSRIGEMDAAVGSQEHLDAQYEQKWVENYLSDGGEQAILDVFFRNGTMPSMYIALVIGDPGETGTPATMTETAGTGYARILLNRNTTDFPTLALDSGDYKVTSAAKVFTAGGTWTAGITHMAIVTSASGTTGSILAVQALSATRNPVNTDTITCTFATKLS